MAQGSQTSRDSPGSGGGPHRKRPASEASWTSERDPGFLRRQLAASTLYTRLFSPEVRGVENLPETGPVLLVGNHSCLFYTPDTWVVAQAVTARRGVDAPAFVLAYDLLLATPLLRGYLRRMGAVRAGAPEAERALRRGALVLVYPGGDWEASRPWSQRNRIDLAGRTGFVRLALATRVPVVPVVAHGSHDAVVILARGDRLARSIGLGQLRIKVFPILLGPLGPTTVLTPPLPMPSAITVEFLPALEWARHPTDADDATVRACYEEITATMQSALDRLRAERRHPLAHGWCNLLGSLARGRSPGGSFSQP